MTAEICDSPESGPTESGPPRIGTSSSILDRRSRLLLTKRLLTKPTTITKVPRQLIQISFLLLWHPEPLPAVRIKLQSPGHQGTQNERAAKPLLSVRENLVTAVTASVERPFGVFLSCTCAHRGRHAHMIARARPAPDKTCLAGVGSKGPSA